MRDLKIIRRLKVVHSVSNKNTSWRSIDEATKFMLEQFDEIDELLEQLLEVDLVRVNASDDAVRVLLDERSPIEKKGFKVRKSEDETKVEINPADRKTVERAYFLLERKKDIMIHREKYFAFLQDLDYKPNSREFKAHKKVIDKRFNETLKEIDRAEGVIRKVAREGYLDTYFKKFLKETMKRLTEHFKGLYDKSERKLFVNFYDDHLEIKAFLIFNNLHAIESNENFRQYCVRFTLVLGGDLHRSKWIKVLDGFKIPKPNEDKGEFVKDSLDAYYYIVTSMEYDGIDKIEDYGKFPEVDIKRADWRDLANAIEIGEEGSYIMFRLKPKLLKTDQYKAAQRLKEILLSKILQPEFHDVHDDIVFTIDQIKRSKWVRFTPKVDDYFAFNTVSLKNLEKEVPELSPRDKIQIMKIIQLARKPWLKN